MRKQTKLVAVLSAAALLAIGASMTSFAATGWTEEDGTWVYYDKDGYKVESTWKPSGNNWYYLDDTGHMATSKLIVEDTSTYYVDETGKMVANRWVELENEDYLDSSDDEEEPETVWYYFQSSGKAYKGNEKTSFKTINGKKYAFDTDGKMLFGWVNDSSTRETGDEAFTTAKYYCGDSNDGARVSSDWRQLYISDNGPGYEMEDQENAWFYFGTNGEKVASDSENTLKEKKINGKTYTFDSTGVMRASWQYATKTSASELNGYYSDIDNGARQKGWFKAIPSEKVNETDYKDDAEKWYYGNNNGKLVVNELKLLNGKRYAFNSRGEMLSGLWVLELNSKNQILSSSKLDKETEVSKDNYYNVVSQVIDEDKGSQFDGSGKVSVYYFGNSDDGSMKTGNQTIEIDGDNYQFSFGKTGSSKGKGITSKDNDKTLYIHGMKIKADSDYKYQAVDKETGVVEPLNVDSTVPSGLILVNASGNIMKSVNGYYKDADGYFYTVNAKGEVLTYISQKPN